MQRLTKAVTRPALRAGREPGRSAQRAGPAIAACALLPLLVRSLALLLAAPSSLTLLLAAALRALASAALIRWLVRTLPEDRPGSARRPVRRARAGALRRPRAHGSVTPSSLVQGFVRWAG